MCFSAGASLTAGVLLTFIGVETLKKVHKPAQLIFASIPLFFAIQQFAEGILWLTIAREGYQGVRTAATYMFIIMAQILWPVMIPLSVLLLEKNSIRKKILYVMAFMGCAVGIYDAYLLIAHGIYAEVSSRHLTYQSGFQDDLGWTALILYLAVTVLPLFISGVKRMYILGIIMAVSFAVSAVFYMQCLTSVWCFFAAVISFVVFYIIRDAHRQMDFSSEKKK
ncbi:MAG: hypothetical protein CVV21_04865 [Candidatus Goldiibacteriota bacterium HGW-Goldbacteria-1]|jgi:hypothetical protein|nr:MAG: hypothetical protein CVV21_04865 [Candidatus Goldiibacteriota bacterium HGW-Goldbacteria-1]